MKNNKRQKRKNLTTATIMLAAITTVVWLVLLIVKYITFGMNVDELLDEILSNILGILPPIIIFNFAYEYITKDYMADEISEELTEVLMGNLNALSAFKDDVKTNFVKSTIESIVGCEKTEAVYGAIEPYIVLRHNLRTIFDYRITINDLNDKVFADFLEVSSALNYYSIKEHYICEKIYCDETENSDVCRIGFFTELGDLDKGLKGTDFIFSEKLKISSELLNSLIGLTQTEKCNFVKNAMKLTFFLEDELQTISKVDINENGIFVEYGFREKHNSQKSKMEIGFTMPQLKNNCELLVSITEPTKNPKINVQFDSSKVYVKTYPFLDSDIDTVTKSQRVAGEISISPDGWIYPVKGVLFVVEENV